MKPLYLEARRRTEIELDGPSLTVREENKALRRYPISRLSRLVVSGNCRWSHEALLACLDHGVPIALLAPDGSVRGFGLPMCDPATGDAERWEAFLAKENWRQHWFNWVRSRERREVMETSRLLEIDLPDKRAESARQAFETRLAAWETPVKIREWKSLLESFLAAQVAEHMKSTGIPPDFLLDRRPGFHFLREFTAILSWRLYADLESFIRANETLLRQRNRPPGRFELAAFYESRAEREQKRIRRLWDDFRFFLGGVR